MKISGLTVCVDYADLLQKGMNHWARGLDRLVVVTSPKDEATLALCQFWGAECHQTDAFYRNGAAFNKGLAISEAVDACHWLEDWQLLFDADIIPLEHWRGIVETAGIQAGNLYGAKRVMEDGSENRHDLFELPGYFQLFHSSDRNAQLKPLLDCGWRHGGGYDSEFQARWSRGQKLQIPMTLIHQGQPGRNWWGRNNQAAMDAMLRERTRTRQLAKCEKLERVVVSGPWPWNPDEDEPCPYDPKIHG